MRPPVLLRRGAAERQAVGASEYYQSTGNNNKKGLRAASVEISPEWRGSTPHDRPSLLRVPQKKLGRNFADHNATGCAIGARRAGRGGARGLRVPVRRGALGGAGGTGAPPSAPVSLRGLNGLAAKTAKTIPTWMYNTRTRLAILQLRVNFSNLRYDRVPFSCLDMVLFIPG